MELTQLYELIIDGYNTFKQIRIIAGSTNEVSSSKCNIAQKYINEGANTVRFKFITSY